MEGSTHLVYQKDILNEFNNFRNDKLIILLREPASRIYSSFNFTKYTLGNFKQNISFLQYVEALLNNDSKKIEKWISIYSTSKFILPKELNYSKYYFHLQIWDKILTSENLCLLQFEKFIKDFEASYSNLICDFLGLEDLKISDFEKIRKNKSLGVRSQTTQFYVNKISQLFPISPLKEELKRWYYSIQGTPIPKDDETILALNLLKSYFKPYNKLLKNYSQLDLSLWE